FISDFFKLNSQIFVAIAAVSSMKPSMSESLDDMKKRLFTAVIGVIIGYLASKISLPLLLEPLIAGLGVLIIIYILAILKMRDMTQLSCIVFVASFCSDSDKVVYAFNRILGTVIGVLVGVLVNYYISSPNIWEDFISVSIKSYNSANRVLREIIYDKRANLNDFNENLANANTLYKLLEKEVKTPFHHGHSLDKETTILFLLESISVRLAIINNMNANYLSEKVSNEANKRYELDEPFSKNLNEVEAVYNYHIEYIFKYMDELKELVEEI
ncbi:MAG: FUSC family protein, partial [Peptoniphilus harei]|nr:FUSC family protein [Peptoniphilus harei]